MEVHPCSTLYVSTVILNLDIEHEPQEAGVVFFSLSPCLFSFSWVLVGSVKQDQSDKHIPDVALVPTSYLTFTHTLVVNKRLQLTPRGGREDSWLSMVYFDNARCNVVCCSSVVSFLCLNIPFGLCSAPDRTGRQSHPIHHCGGHLCVCRSAPIQKSKIYF